MNIKCCEKNRIFDSAAIRVALFMLPVFAVAVSLFFGRYPLSAKDVFNVIFNNEYSSAKACVTVLELRLPRAVAAAFVGASLAVSGAAFQSAFRNPIVNSGILGVSSGAGFGACVAIVLLGGGFMTYVSAFAFSIIAVLMSLFAGRISGLTTTVTLVLGGTIVSTFFSSLVAVMKYIADPYSQLPSITFWLMGSMASVGSKQLIALLPMAAGILAVFFSRRWLNVISMGDREASTLGLDVRKCRFVIIGGATLCTASAVCISGTIGWVGLVIPNICRMIFGNNNKNLVPASISLGATFLVVADLFARNISSAEFPIGILCALIGTPFFVYLLKKTRGGVIY